MLKSVEETTLLTKLEELVQLAKKKKNVLEYKEIMDHLADLDLDPTALTESMNIWKVRILIFWGISKRRRRLRRSLT